MSNANLVVTRGGVTYEVPEPTLRADEVIHSLRIGSARYFFAERLPEGSIANDAHSQAHHVPASRTYARASNTNDLRRPTAGRASAVTSEELANMWQTLDLSDRDDVRVAALFILLREGLRKNEIVRLNLADLTDDGQALQLRVEGSLENGRDGRMVSFSSPQQASILRRYLAFEHKETQYLDAPLFWTLGRHGTCRRVRITSHALSYWVTQLQRRAGIERRLSPHAFRRAWLAEGIAEADELGGETFGLCARVRGLNKPKALKIRRRRLCAAALALRPAFASRARDTWVFAPAPAFLLSSAVATKRPARAALRFRSAWGSVSCSTARAARRYWRLAAS